MTEAIEKPAKKALKQYKIMFSGEGGDVEIGHNYKLNVYKRNVWTTIDENYLDVLRNTVITTTKEGSDGKPMEVRIPTYNYEVEPL